MSKYADIIERLEAAEGPDRELDARVHAAANPDDLDMTNIGYLPGEVCAELAGFKGVRSIAAPAYTTSLDAAVGLVERMLPQHGRMHSKGRLSTDEPLYGVKLYEHELCVGDDPFEIAEAEHDNEPIAILLALFHALQSQENSGE